MIIGIDGNEANVANRVGIGQYAYQILKHLYESQKLKVKNQKLLIKFRIYLKNFPLSDLPVENEWWQYIVVGPRKFWTQAALPIRLFTEKQKPDVFFSPAHYAPRFASCPTVISIMDLSYLYFPEMFTKKDLYQLRNWTAYSVKKAAKILTISEHSKKDIIKLYNIPENKIIVTYPGYDEKKFKVKNQSFERSQDKKLKVSDNALLRKFEIVNEFILFVGTLQPRKNIIRLIEAFQLSMKQLNNDSMKLLIVGKKGWLFNEIYQKAQSSLVKNRIVFADFVTVDELAVLYRHARCFVLPSLYEGFGIPVIEAMASGCPLVVSNASSLPEVVGEAGILVDPLNTQMIADGILEMLHNPNKRAECIRKGKERVKMFSWTRCIDQTLEAIYSTVKH